LLYQLSYGTVVFAVANILQKIKYKIKNGRGRIKIGRSQINLFFSWDYRLKIPAVSYFCTPIVEKVKINTSRLKNGIRIIQQQVESPAAHFGIILNTGSRDELADEQGIAHFIEHVIFKGTKKRKAFQSSAGSKMWEAN